MMKYVVIRKKYGGYETFHTDFKLFFVFVLFVFCFVFCLFVVFGVGFVHGDEWGGGGEREREGCKKAAVENPWTLSDVTGDASL